MFDEDLRVAGGSGDGDWGRPAIPSEQKVSRVVWDRLRNGYRLDIRDSAQDTAKR